MWFHQNVHRVSENTAQVAVFMLLNILRKLAHSYYTQQMLTSDGVS